MPRMFYTTEAKVSQYESVYHVFNELFKELKELGKKKPDQTLSVPKVKIINRVLEDVKDCLDEEPNFKYLDTLDEDSLPQYGDAILILSQYEGVLKSFKERHYGYFRGNSNVWVIRKEEPDEDYEEDERDEDVSAEADEDALGTVEEKPDAS